MEKEDSVKIEKLVTVTDGTIYGLGDDMNMYAWHHSFDHAGKWVLYVTD